MDAPVDFTERLRRRRELVAELDALFEAFWAAEGTELRARLRRARMGLVRELRQADDVAVEPAA